MSSSAKRLVLSLRGRGAGGGGGGRGDPGDGTGGGSESGGGSGSGSGAATTSATRLFHCDSGHELDEISVVGTRNGESVTPTTPCHCKYGSGQTLYSVATSVPPAPSAPVPRIVPGEQ